MRHAASQRSCNLQCWRNLVAGAATAVANEAAELTIARRLRTWLSGLRSGRSTPGRHLDRQHLPGPRLRRWSDPEGDHSWVQGSYCRCPECNHDGIVADSRCSSPVMHGNDCTTFSKSDDFARCNHALRKLKTYDRHRQDQRRLVWT